MRFVSESNRIEYVIIYLLWDLIESVLGSCKAGGAIRGSVPEVVI
jgi:hypothetical protein